MEMVTKQCKCCNNKFKVSITSAQDFCSTFCAGRDNPKLRKQIWVQQQSLNGTVKERERSTPKTQNTVKENSSVERNGGMKTAKEKNDETAKGIEMTPQQRIKNEPNDDEETPSNMLNQPESGTQITQNALAPSYPQVSGVATRPTVLQDFTTQLREETLHSLSTLKHLSDASMGLIDSIKSQKTEVKNLNYEDTLKLLDSLKVATNIQQTRIAAIKVANEIT